MISNLTSDCNSDILNRMYDLPKHLSYKANPVSLIQCRSIYYFLMKLNIEMPTKIFTRENIASVFEIISKSSHIKLPEVYFTTLNNVLRGDFQVIWGILWFIMQGVAGSQAFSMLDTIISPGTRIQRYIPTLYNVLKSINCRRERKG